VSDKLVARLFAVFGNVDEDNAVSSSAPLKINLIGCINLGCKRCVIFYYIFLIDIRNI
jgi:hypothetical protein